ncbi:GNAT family N-acetyltransferase [Aciduricibacillus chroicocephali]|uniref:GNAT family N-acetyltransferase n=1 Tax=Aciduricibacillus chroicocephali TaxID=3054939 RepID=A0ABY9KWH1_9BACI|nr:GNAT family N-acetyltransferase [Bacillaceae bacterium 44XB]
MKWNIKKFEEFTIDELYEVMKQRCDVFVVEQHCMDLDLDGLDRVAEHCFLRNEDGTVIAYCRLLPAGTKYSLPSIGRVLVAKEYRRQGYATKLMEKAISHIEREWKEEEIKVQAQAHLQDFYGSLGFNAVSEVYEDVGIPHIDMIRKG